MPYAIDLSRVTQKNIYPLGNAFRGTAPDGTEIGFTNYYMTVDGTPKFGITGEMHYSRVREDEWEDSIIKAKMDGVNIIATYVFWNVHEEIRGKFRFDGCRNIRGFIELCKKHGMMVIVRIGPFDHGEMRNGGMPDWLYGMPFEVRNNSDGYFFYVRRLFRKLHEQMDGLYFSQGGPIVGTQIENEYMHSSSGWEITTGVSNELLNGGHDREDHMLALKKIAVEEGIVTPFYTCTAWGGAMTPVDEMIPLWGGYAYQPWIFYGGRGGEHPMTPEYIYRDNHNNAVTKTYNFEPHFEPESRPYACCEMMGGMFNSYQYRFILPHESIDALANIKLGSGCNLLGYYMYRGGTNPVGERTPYLNEHYAPKRSYDFQAAIGENGQTRLSYFRLRPLHLFCTAFSDVLCRTKAVLPEHLEVLAPGDFSKLRYSVRVNGNSGFVFINNFQDHAEMPDIKDESITLILDGETLTIDGIGIAGGENAILPFNMNVNGAVLKTATAQPVTFTDTNGEKTWFFLAPDGMTPVYKFDARTVTDVNGCASRTVGNITVCTPNGAATSDFTLTTANGKTRIVTLTRADSLRFSKINVRGKDYAFLNDGTVLWDGKSLRIESDLDEIEVMSYPPLCKSAFGKSTADITSSVFEGCRIKREQKRIPLGAKKVGPSRYVIDVPKEELIGHKRVELRIDYVGDIGHLFVDGELVSDNFCNGTTWVSRIDDLASALAEHPITLYITPIRKNAKINVDSPMAARFESADGIIAEIDSITLVPIDESEINI